MDFKVREGFSVEADRASVDLAQQSDDVVRAAFEESRRVATERGLWIPAEAGKLVVATEVPGVRDILLSTAEEGATLYNTVINGINSSRRKSSRIPILQPGEYRERAEDWLTDELAVVSELLPETTDRPLLIIPRLNYNVSREEIVEAIGAASDRGLWSWAGRMDFLNKFSPNDLSGFDPTLEPEETGFQIVPTAYDEAREGIVSEQKEGLAKLQREGINEIHVSPVFMTAVLGQRYKGQDRYWRDTYTRGIDLEPVSVGGDGYVPDAYVRGGGSGDVDDSNVRSGSAARLLARS